MRQIKQKLKMFYLAMFAGLALCAPPSFAEIKALEATSRPMTLAAATKTKSPKAGSGKRSAKYKSKPARHQQTAPKHHATWHAPHVGQMVNTQKTSALHPNKTPKKVRRSQNAAPKIKAKQKSVAALPQPTLPAPDKLAPPEVISGPQQASSTATKSLAAKPLIRRPKPAITDVDTDSDRIVVEESSSPSYSLIMLALLMAAGASYMYFTRRQQTLVNRRQPERHPKSSPSDSRPSRHRHRQSDATNISKIPVGHEPVSGMPESAAEATMLGTDDYATTPPPPDSSSAIDGTAKLPAAPHCTFELFVEIQVALSAWIDQGADTLANLQKHFELSEADWLQESAHWGPKYLADDELLRKFNALSTEFRTKYRGSAA